MAERDLPHIVVPAEPRPEPFTIPVSGRDSYASHTVGDRRGHGTALIKQFENATAPVSDAPAVEGVSDAPAVEGTYISFISFPGLELALESLDPQRPGEQPELVAVREQDSAGGVLQIATVYIPDGKKEYFLRRLARYVESADEERAKHATLVEGIQTIQRATIRELWTDAPDSFPADPSQARWWEVWLRKRDGRELNRFTSFAAANALRTSEHYLGFGDRTVVLVHATADQLANAFRWLDDIAELRQPHDVASFLSELPAFEQADWVEDVQQRLRPASSDAPVVCILDTGVQAEHPLLIDSITATDLHVADPLWQLPPVERHGTEMAGLALYGDLHGAVLSSDAIELRHRLESVKFLPDRGNNDQDLYGAVTARAVDQPEIQAIDRPRVFMLAVTAPRPKTSTGGKAVAVSEAGKPTSWSAAIDALAFGRAIDDTDRKFTYLDRDEPRRPRLFVISAGNIPDVDAADDHLERSDLEPVEDPAQAWNALTVGAYSPHDDMSGAPADFAGYQPIAPRGELSPVSRTSVVFDRGKWPFKPDVVADGGNVAASPDKTIADTPENLAVLTTRFQPFGGGFFTTTRDTSAATASVAAIAADIYAAYPDLRPETVRALGRGRKARAVQLDVLRDRIRDAGAGVVSESAHRWPLLRAVGATLKRDDRSPEHRREPVVPARGLAVEPGLHELVAQRRTWCELGRVEAVAGLLCELREEHELRAGVALPEAVDDVQLTPTFCELVDELPMSAAAQQIVRGELRVLGLGRLVHDVAAGVVAVRDRLRVAGVEHVRAVLRHPTLRADTGNARPLIDVLEDRGVDGLHVRVVEPAGDRCLGQLADADGRRGLLHRAQLHGVGFAVGLARRGELVA